MSSTIVKDQTVPGLSSKPSERYTVKTYKTKDGHTVKEYFSQSLSDPNHCWTGKDQKKHGNLEGIQVDNKPLVLTVDYYNPGQGVHMFVATNGDNRGMPWDEATSQFNTGAYAASLASAAGALVANKNQGSQPAKDAAATPQPQADPAADNRNSQMQASMAAFNDQMQETKAQIWAGIKDLAIGIRDAVQGVLGLSRNLMN